jgi:hypothetical protein
MGANLHRLLTKSAWDGAMQITSSTAHPVSPSVATGPQRVETEAGRFALAVAEPDGRPSVEDIFAKYDLNNISPREIDLLVDELRDNGHTDDVEMIMMLETRGERFMRHLRESVGVEAVANDYEAKFDLIGSIKTQIQFARAHGDPTEASEELLAMLERYDAQRDTQLRPSARNSSAENMVRAALG